MDYQEISLAAFLPEALPLTGHNRTQILSMAVNQEVAVVIKDGRNVGKGKDLLYHHAEDNYKITLTSIKEYFSDPNNPRPKRVLNVQDENTALKAEIAELKKQVGKEKGVVPGPTKPVTETKARTGATGEAEIPPRDDDIPVKKLSQTDYAKKLAADLKDKKGPSLKAVASAQKKEIPKG